MKLKNYFIRATPLAAMAALILFSGYAAANTDWAGSVANNSGGGIGTWARNLANEIMGSVTLLDALMYFGSVCSLIFSITTVVKNRKTRGQDGDLGLAAVAFIAACVLMAGPTFLGGGTRSITGSGNVNTVKPPSATPNFN